MPILGSLPIIWKPQEQYSYQGDSVREFNEQDLSLIKREKREKKKPSLDAIGGREIKW